MVNFLDAPAARALHPIRPPGFRQEGPTGFFGGKLFVKGINGFHGFISSCDILREDYQEIPLVSTPTQPPEKDTFQRLLSLQETM
jgi:hypothetical protein